MLLRSSAVAITFAVTAAVAHGQQCALVTDNPPDLRTASRYIGMIADAGPSARPNEKPTYFRRALNTLYQTSADVDRSNRYLLGRLYAVWLVVDLPGARTTTTREDLGLVGGVPSSKHDLYMAMDSAFARVEAEGLACADSTARYRRAVSQMAFNAARMQLAAKSYDSAVVLAKRALVADPKAVAPLNLIAEANKQRGDTTSFREARPKVSRAPARRFSFRLW